MAPLFQPPGTDYIASLLIARNEYTLCTPHTSLPVSGDLLRGAGSPTLHCRKRAVFHRMETENSSRRVSELFFN